MVTLDAPCTADVADSRVGTSKYIRTCEITITARLDDMVEIYENLSLKAGALNYAPVRTAKSELIRVEVEPKADAETVVPYELCGGTGSELVLTPAGGSNGTVLTVAAGTYLARTTAPASAPACRPSWRTATCPSWPSPASPCPRCSRP